MKKRLQNIQNSFQHLKSYSRLILDIELQLFFLEKKINKILLDKRFDSKQDEIEDWANLTFGYPNDHTSIKTGLLSEHRGENNQAWAFRTTELSSHKALFKSPNKRRPAITPNKMKKVSKTSTVVFKSFLKPSSTSKESLRKTLKKTFN